MKSLLAELICAILIPPTCVAIITYFLVAIIESELKLNRDIYEVKRILGSSMLVKDNIKGLFIHAEYDILYKNGDQLE